MTTILSRYDEAFASLTTEELSVLLPAMGLPLTHPSGRIFSGSDLLDHCRSHHISQADVCLSLYNVTGPVAISALERLIMRPIDRRTPYEVNVSRLPVPPGSHRARSTATTGGRRTWPADGIIRVLAETNPKKPGSESHTRFQLYEDGITVAAYYERGGRPADISWDSDRGFVRVDDPA